MATYFARKSGNINATDVWSTTPSGAASDLFPSFTSGDVLVANSFTITINVSVNLGSTGELRNGTFGGATAGGSFSLSNGVTLTANVVGSDAGVATATLAGAASATIAGNLTGGSVASAVAVAHSSSNTLTIVGAVTGGTGSSTHGLNTTSAGTSLITGNVTSGTGTNACGVSTATAAGTLTIVGAVTGAASGTGGLFSGAILLGATTNCTVTGNVTGQAYAGIRMQSSATLTMTGTVICNGADSGISVNQANSTMTIVGTATGGTSPGINLAFNTTVTLTRAKGGPNIASSVGIAASAGSIVTLDEIEYGDLGAPPTSGPIRFSDKTTNVAVMYRFGTTKKSLTDPASTNTLPAQSDVRSGINYGGGTNRTGTMAVPLASQVAAGVSVDNTTGTLAVTTGVMQSAFDAALSAFSSGRLNNCATVSTVGQQISNALTKTN